MLTQDRLKELLSYDPDTGVFKWKIRRGGKATCDVAAGTKDPGGYVRIGIDKKIFKAHRLIWLYVHGALPLAQVDHINGDGYDNRLSNLRLVNNSENQQNLRKARINNRCGFLGVSVRSGKYEASIMVNGKKMRIGVFENAEKAHQAYLNKKREVHVACTI